LLIIRSSIFSIGYFLLTISYGTLSLASWAFPHLTRHKLIASWTTVVISWLRISCGVRHKVIGKEHIDQAKVPFVVLAKHQSAWETLFLQSLFWPSSTVLKRELLNIPFFGWGLRALSPIAIDRSNPREALKQVKSKSLQRIDQGLNIILFPEGTRMPPGEKGSYARSGADIAKTSGAEIFPVAVNAGKCWPSRSFTKYPGEITVSIGPKIDAEGKNNREIMGEVESWIENEMSRIETA